jgi:hypothetical protein
VGSGRGPGSNVYVSEKTCSANRSGPFAVQSPTPIAVRKYEYECYGGGDSVDDNDRDGEALYARFFVLMQPRRPGRWPLRFLATTPSRPSVTILSQRASPSW